MLFRSTDPNIADSISQKGFGIVNARIHWRDPLGHEGITASIFARNLFDKIYGTSATALNNALGVTSKQFGEPRIFGASRSEEHTSELQSLMRISYAVFCLKKKKK